MSSSKPTIPAPERQQLLDWLRSKLPSPEVERARELSLAKLKDLCTSNGKRFPSKSAMAAARSAFASGEWEAVKKGR